MPSAPQLLLSGCITLAALIAFPRSEIAAGLPLSAAPLPVYPISVRAPDPAAPRGASTRPGSLRAAVLRTPCAALWPAETEVAGSTSGVKYPHRGRSDSLREIVCHHGQPDGGRPLRPVFF